MNTKNENIDFWIGRILMIFFFLFIVSFSNSDSNSQIDSGVISVEKIIDSDNSAILIEPTGIPNYDNSLVNCKLYDLKIRDTKSVVWISNNTINHQFTSEELRFFKFKPKLLKLHLIRLKISSNEDYPLIS